MTPYEKLKERAEQILGTTLDEFTFNELYLVLNKYNTTSGTSSFFHVLAQTGEIFLMYKTQLWDISETTADDTDFILSDQEQEGIEPIAVGYCQTTGLKLDPLKPLDQQDEQGNATLEAIYTILT